jgi:ATP-binding cassette subfamily B protein
MFMHAQDAGDLRVESLRLNAPGLIVLAGPSGAGKTTLLDLIARELVPAAGRITIRQASALSEFGRADHARHVALMPQRPYLPPGRLCDLLSAHIDISPRDRVAAWLGSPELSRLLIATGLADKLRMRGRNRSEDLTEILQQGIERHGVSVSGGEHQLIGLVRCLASPAEVVLLDEPTTALDSNTAQRVADELRYQGSRRLVICVTHDPQVSAVADAVYHMTAGRLVNDT